jgi:MoaA/NifB/PqqE/SkfB family radical SAM enzyme
MAKIPDFTRYRFGIRADAGAKMRQLAFLVARPKFGTAKRTIRGTAKQIFGWVKRSAHDDKLLREGPAFCMAPWVHLAVSTTGVATPCCEAKGEFGHVGRQSIDEIWYGPEFRNFRAGLIRDKRDARCRKCYDVERSGGFSLRRRFNEDFARRAERLHAKTDGTDVLTPALPVSLDIRFSNLCNFSCRMCWHGASSKWFSDARDLRLTAGPAALLTSFPTAAEGIRALRPLLATVERIQWAGGEPLLIEEHYVILDELLALGRDRVALSYNSNMSELLVGNFDVLALWSRFKHVTLQASVDGVGRRGELIRRGLSWTRFVENVVAVKQRCPHVNILFGITVSVFNVFALPDLHRDLVALGCCSAHDFRIHPLQEAAIYCIQILPPDLKRKVAQDLIAYARTLPADEDGSAEYGPIRRQFQHVIDYMMAADRQELIDRFRTMTLNLDRLRGEETGEICPELAPLLQPSLRQALG